MRHTSVPDPPGFGELSTEEQIRYLQALWDRIVNSGQEVPVPESHLCIAEERLADFRREPNPARSAYEVLDRLVADSG